MPIKMRVIREQTIIQLTCFPRLFPVNCYFVEEEDSLTLVDAALPGCLQSILNEAEKIGKPITRILLTHAHQDHIGALPELKRRLPSAILCLSARDARLLQGDRTVEAGEGSQRIRGGVPAKGAGMPEPDLLLKDGDRIGSLLAIAAPGHTPGSMAFMDTRHHYLIAGDALQTRGGLAVTGHLRYSFPFPAMATWDKRVSIESAKKLCQLKPALLAVGHGEMLRQPLAPMQNAIAAAEKASRK